MATNYAPIKYGSYAAILICSGTEYCDIECGEIARCDIECGEIARCDIECGEI